MKPEGGHSAGKGREERQEGEEWHADILPDIPASGASMTREDPVGGSRTQSETANRARNLRARGTAPGGCGAPRPRHAAPIRARVLTRGQQPLERRRDAGPNGRTCATAAPSPRGTARLRAYGPGHRRVRPSVSDGAHLRRHRSARPAASAGGQDRRRSRQARAIAGTRGPHGGRPTGNWTARDILRR